MTLHTRAADMLERYGRVDGVMHCEVSMLIAELRAAAALDELVRENERLGLYDDQKPVAWRCRDYVTGCWFISVKPDPAGSIAGESVPLYAAPAPAQPRQPLSEWIACSEQMPILSEGDDELPVYTWDGESVKADEFGFLFEQPAGPAVGGWVCIGADFLNNLSGTVTHWMPRNMPAAPIDRAITGGKP